VNLVILLKVEFGENNFTLTVSSTCCIIM